MLLFFTPGVVPVTSTENVQLALDASVPPLKLIEPAPATAVIVPAPHEPVTFGVDATTRPAGRLSVNATPVSATFVFGLVMLKLNVLFAFCGICVGLNDFVMVGGAATVRLEVAVLPVPPLVEDTAPDVLV